MAAFQVTAEDLRHETQKQASTHTTSPSSLAMRTSQRYVRNLPVGASEAVMLKNQRRRNSNTAPTLSMGIWAL